MKSSVVTDSELSSPIRYCLYARKSMEAEERQALSIDSQTKEMRSIAERDRLDIVAVKSEAHSARKTPASAKCSTTFSKI